MEWELKVQDENGKRKNVTWDGETAEAAALRYVDCHREHAVVATRRVTGQGTVSVLGRGGVIVG